MSKQKQKIDGAQLRALVRNSLKLDWRGAKNPMSGYTRKRRAKIPGFLVLLLINMVASVMMGLVFIFAPDFFHALVLASVYAMILVAMQVLMEFGNIIISPTDYPVISPHPVNSKTFYVAKLSHLLIYVAILSTSVTIIPAVMAAFRWKSWAVGPVVLVDFLAVSFFASVLVMNIHTLVLKMVDRNRLERVLSYINTIFILGIYLSFAGLPHYIRTTLPGANLESLTWLKFLPTYWFASWVRLVENGWDIELLLLGMIGLVLLIVLGRLAVSYLSLSYAESLTDMGWSRQVNTKKDEPGLLDRFILRFLSHEDRALIMLVRGNFKHDVQFRIGIMAFVPLLVFYLVWSMILKGGQVRNPFAPLPDTQAMTTIILGFAAIISPYMIMPSLQMSKTWQAGWVFFATPYDRIKIILAMERLSLMIITLPLAVLLWVILTFVFGNPLHSLLHTLTLVALAVIGLSILSMLSIRLPFAMEYTSGNFAVTGLFPMILVTVLLLAPVALISTYGYGGYLNWAGIFAVCLLVGYLLRLGKCRRILKASRDWEFTG